VSTMGPIGALLLLLLLAGASAADEVAADDPPTLHLEPITVTARPEEAPGGLLPSARTTVEYDDLQQGRPPAGLDQALARVPGLFLQNPYNFAQDLRISSRGFGARANFGIRGIRLYVDGIPLTLPDGQTSLDSLDPGTIERIEVMRGPASSRYGPSAGGVIEIHTRDGAGPPFVEGRVGLGEYGFRKYRLSAAGHLRSLHFALDLSHLHGDGYRDHSATRSDRLNAKLRWEIDETSDVALILNLTDSPEADDPGALTGTEVRADRRRASARNRLFDAGEVLDQQRIGAVYRKHFGEHHRLTLRGHSTWRDFDNRLPFTDGGSVDLERLFAGGGLQYAFSGALADHALDLVVGLDAEAQRDDRRRFDNRFGERGGLSLEQDEDVTAYGAYLQGRFEFGGGVRLSAGLRADRVAFDLDDRFGSDGDDSGHRRIDELSPALGATWSPIAGLDLYARYSTSFETPTTTEFANPAGGGLNPDLGSATSENFEIGARGRRPGWLRYELAVFRVKVDDELVPFELPGQSGRSFFRNAGRSTRDGVELGLAVGPLRGLRGTVAYTFSDFTYDRHATPAGVFDGNRIPGIPRHRLFLEAAYRHACGFYAVWDAQYVDDFLADDAGAARTSPYWVSGLRVGQRVRVAGLEVEPYAGVQNLFDRGYDANVRINAFAGRHFEPAPGRNVFGGVRLRWEFGD